MLSAVARVFERGIIYDHSSRCFEVNNLSTKYHLAFRKFCLTVPSLLKTANGWLSSMKKNL